MAEIRTDPLSGDFIIINDKRMDRPVISKELEGSLECPFCASSSKRHPGLPLEYKAITVDNLYPSLQLGQPFETKNTDKRLKENIYVSTPNVGKCEVLLYSSEHELEFYDQSKELTEQIMKLWQHRYNELQKISEIRYIFIFENRGIGVGATISHPHGQLYALPFIPPIVKRTLKKSKKYFKKHNSCLLCDIIIEERKDGRRIVLENEDFIAFVPFYSKMLYEIHIIPIKHHKSIKELGKDELNSFGSIIKDIRRKYDKLFSRKSSFMMMLFNSPVNITKEYNFHFYLQFFCVDRDEHNLKHRASVETGLNLWTNDSSPERIAEVFRKK